MTRPRTSVLTGIFLIAAALTLVLVMLTTRSSGHGLFVPKAGAAADPDSAVARPGMGANTYDAWQSAIRTYPANVIPVSVVQREQATFSRIAKRDARLAKLRGRTFFGTGGPWSQYGPRQRAVQPGVTSFSGRDERHGEPDHGDGRLARLRRQGREVHRLCRRCGRRRVAD